MNRRRRPAEEPKPNFMARQPDIWKEAAFAHAERLDHFQANAYPATARVVVIRAHGLSRRFLELSAEVKGELVRFRVPFDRLPSMRLP